MSNPYTLNMLYQNGIIDYIPTELMTQVPLAAFNPMQNQYLNQAMNGAMFQNYNLNDTFTSNSTQNISYDNSTVGIKSNINENIYGTYGVGKKGIGSMGIVDSTLNAFGFTGAGKKNQNTELNAWGISENTINNFSANVQNNNGIKSLIGLGLLFIAGLSIKKCFKSPKKIVTEKTPSKLNPLNWFRKNKTK